MPVQFGWEDAVIFDSIDNLEVYYPQVPLMRIVVEVMDRGDVYDQEPGAYQTRDPKVRYIISSYETTSKDVPFEIHRRSTDVQILLEGEELMSASWREAGKDAIDAYDKAEDVQHTTGEPLAVWHAAVGRFALFLPGEPHKTGVAIGLPRTNKKVVFRIYD